jgi:bifunctional DNA-binding transcriptional regulator/antitoxin component of YhaV-PrlF toxin-antitoxin module
MPKQYKNPGPITFTAKIEERKERNSGGAWVYFPYDLKETYGVGNLVPVKATFDGKVIYKGRLAKMGGPHPMIGVLKSVREELGKQPGDTIEVIVELDDAPREIAVADDIKKALEETGQLEYFEGLAFTHRKEYIQWIEEAKKPETRVNRIKKMCDMLAAKQKA